MRIFISSVRSGLEDERDSLPGLIAALGHEPVRFEDFTAQDAPSREACVKGVESSDVYLLILGPHYGHIFPDTHQSATHDEWATATRMGLPRYVFEKSGVKFDTEQEQFARTLGDYASGRFHGSFSTTPEFLTKATGAIRDLETAPGSLTYRPLTESIVVPWLEQDRSSIAARGLLEVHIIPLNGRPLSDRILEQVAGGLPAVVRAAGMVSATAGVDVQQYPGTVILASPAQERGSWGQATEGALSSVGMDGSGAMSIVLRLPGDSMGSMLDPDDATGWVARALHLAGQLDQSKSADFAVAVGITSQSMLTVGSRAQLPRSSAIMGGGAGPARVTPDEAISRAALDQGAIEVAAASVRALSRTIER